MEKSESIVAGRGRSSGLFGCSVWVLIEIFGLVGCSAPNLKPQTAEQAQDLKDVQDQNRHHADRKYNQQVARDREFLSKHR